MKYVRSARKGTIIKVPYNMISLILKTDLYKETIIPVKMEIGTFIGTCGFFLVLFLLYSRTFPVIAQAELKTIVKSSSTKYNKNLQYLDKKELSAIKKIKRKRK